jgi:hypothetical protein
VSLRDGDKGDPERTGSRVSVEAWRGGMKEDDEATEVRELVNEVTTDDDDEEEEVCVRVYNPITTESNADLRKKGSLDRNTNTVSLSSSFAVGKRVGSCQLCTRLS